MIMTEHWSAKNGILKHCSMSYFLIKKKKEKPRLDMRDFKDIEWQISCWSELCNTIFIVGSVRK
jgi:hypothetical protein